MEINLFPILPLRWTLTCMNDCQDDESISNFLYFVDQGVGRKLTSYSF